MRHSVVGFSLDESNGEALHSLARQLFFGRLGELRDRALEDQIHRASCLHLLIAVIAAWNTIYLSARVRDAASARRRDLRDNRRAYRAAGLGAHQSDWQVSVRAATRPLIGESSPSAFERAKRRGGNLPGSCQLKRWFHPSVGVIATERWNVLTTAIFHTFWNVLFQRAFPFLHIR